MVPGIYDVKISNDGTREVKWIRDIELVAGQTVEKELTFDQSVLIIRGFDSNNDPLSLYGNIFPADDEDDRIGSKGWSSELKFTMEPGTYSLKIAGDGIRENKWLRNISLEAGKTVEKEVSF